MGKARRFLQRIGSLGFPGVQAALAAWDYPRGVWTDELERSFVFRYGEQDSIVWLEEVIGEPRTRILHIAVEPSLRRHHSIGARGLFRELYKMARWMDLDRLIANDCTESGEVTDYLKRLGWKPCVMETIEGEWYERRFVDGKAQEETHEQASTTQDRPSECGGGHRGEAGSHREGAQESSPATRTGRERVRTP